MGASTDRDFVRPVVVISECLDFAACRYNGVKIPHDLTHELAPYVEFRPVCPEIEIGLGVPRDPIRLVRSPLRSRAARPGRGDGVPDRLVQLSTARDVTREMDGFSHRFLGGLDTVDGFILKSRSPSCGIRGVKIFAGPEAKSPVARQSGLFAAHVLDEFPWAAIEEDSRLLDDRLRHHFLTKLFALARLRGIGNGVGARAGVRELVAFHARHELLLMACPRAQTRALARLVANPDGKPLADLVGQYRILLGTALHKPARAPSIINVLEHAYGYLSRHLDGREKRLYRSELEHHRQGRLPRGGMTALIHSWAVRFEVDYLLGQSFFKPYPQALMNAAAPGAAT